jgi:hypothetical protein
MLSEGTSVRLRRDVDGDTLPRIPAGTYGVIVEVYEVPVEGYAVDVAIREPNGEYLYDNVILHPDQFMVLRHPCWVQIDTDLDRPALVALVEEALEAKAEGGMVTTDAVVAEIEGPWPRDLAHEVGTRSRTFPYEADIEGRPGASVDDVASAVSALLHALWNRGIPAIGLCDYDDRLPDGGGFERWRKLRPGERR